jgi:uncharacterized protein (TIGR02147 family)
MQTHLILQKYLEKKKTRAGYSLRSLAAELEVSVSFLSRVFSGKKAVPYTLLLRLQRPLEIEPEVFENIRRAHTRDIDGNSAPVRGKVQVHTELQDWELTGKPAVGVLRHWYYLAILECSTLKHHDGSAAAMARELGLSSAVVEIALREMTSLGLMTEVGGRLVKSRRKLRWGSSRSVTEIRRFHDQMMTKAQEELRTQQDEAAFEKRLITGITLTTSPKKIQAAKKKLAEFLHELANDLITDEDSEVYQLAVQFFPLTKGDKDAG